MSEIASASINTFGKTSPKAVSVSPSEQLITLTYSQLQDLIAQRIAAFYIFNAKEIAELVYSAMEAFDEAVALLPAGRATLRSSLRDALLKEGRDPIQGIRIIETHTKTAMALLKEASQ